MLDISILASLAKSEILSHLQYISGSKDLIIHHDLMKLLERIIGVSFLRAQGVQKIYKLEKQLMSDSLRLVYIIPPIVSVTRTLIDHMKRDDAQMISREYLVLFYPSRNFIIDSILEQELVLSGNVSIENLNFNFIPLEKDVISLEQNFFYKDLYIENTMSPLEFMSDSVKILLSLFGLIPTVYTVGEKADILCEMIKDDLLNSDINPKQTIPSIGRMIVFDRDVDKITPCVSQVSYEGLLSEEFSINSGFLTIEDKSVLKKLPANSSKILLNDKNPVYSRIRNLHITQTFVYLRNELNLLKDKETEVKSKSRSVAEMKDFVSNELKLLQARRQFLSTHLTCGEALMHNKEKNNFSEQLYFEDEVLHGRDNKSLQTYLQSLIVRERPLEVCLRLVSLWCLCTNPSQKSVDFVKKLVLTTFGYEHIVTLERMESLGYLKPFSPSLSKVSKIYNILPKEPEDKYNPMNTGSVYGGKYNPVSCKIIESIINPNGFDNVKSSPYKNDIREFHFLSQNHAEAEDYVLLLFIGGITHSEISCIRILGANYGLKFLIATTCIINGNDLMKLYISD